MLADPANARIGQYKGIPKEAPTKNRGHADTLKNALENAKNTIISDQRPIPVPEINSRSQSGSHLSERERINRERERLQKEREMLMHEVERPTSTHVPRNERLIKIMRDMDAEPAKDPLYSWMCLLSCSTTQIPVLHAISITFTPVRSVGKATEARLRALPYRPILHRCPRSPHTLLKYLLVASAGWPKR